VKYYADMRNFMQSFEFMHDDVDARYFQQSGIKYLETILNNTATIIHQTNTIPKSETDVYTAVKAIIHAVFSTAKKASSNFLKIAKEYKPDILIPELGAVIEYKYAKDEAKLKATIEQIAADAKGYTGDKDYKLFYVVFYVTNDLWGDEKFKKVWKENDFPRNWKAFYKVGK
jgi:REase_DpnII-MboI